jgi:hypothetical protein
MIFTTTFEILPVRTDRVTRPLFSTGVARQTKLLPVYLAVSTVTMVNLLRVWFVIWMQRQHDGQCPQTLQSVFLVGAVWGRQWQHNHTHSLLSRPHLDGLMTGYQVSLCWWVWGASQSSADMTKRQFHCVTASFAKCKEILLWTCTSALASL